MEQSGSKVENEDNYERSDSNTFPLKLNRIPLKLWGCQPIESNYIKKYKVGQGSYGFGVH